MLGATMKTMRYYYRQSGYITLLSVIVVSAIGSVIATSLLLWGVGASQTSATVAQSVQARSYASACVEEALEQIRDAKSFVGTATLVFANWSCVYTVTSQGNQSRTVVATSTVSTVVRKISVSITNITPVITIQSWQEN